MLRVNKARCKLCGEVIESKHRHDFVTCECGNLSIDGGLDYARRCADSREDFEDLCEYDETDEVSEFEV